MDIQENEMDIENECLRPRLENYTEENGALKRAPFFFAHFIFVFLLWHMRRTSS